jgi:hypothetical protein
MVSSLPFLLLLLQTICFFIVTYPYILHDLLDHDSILFLT